MEVMEAENIIKKAIDDVRKELSDSDFLVVLETIEYEVDSQIQMTKDELE